MHIFRRKEVAILIPIYRIELTENEKIALSQCAKILKKYDIIIIHPNNIDIAKIKNDYQIGKAKPFDRKYFSNTNGYNRLLLTIDFYREFLQYKFILIYQLDAFVFHDSLQYWCRQDYDYVGAPWIGEAWPHAIMRNTKKPLWANNFIFRYLFFAKENFVGNGGFSLRKISSAIIALAILKKHAISWEINEDIFWSIFVRNTLPFFKIPDIKTAVSFSLELEPRKGFSLNGNRLPFGCHAWEKWDIEFWRPHFLKYGYRI